ncbi:MAG: hypothetical protein HC852_10300 [Acaryochloridaceae cyanobacterium RU_4_10]|nr:hypothetical protein [Acaryochloridaceae cyanobacterium RU_4_10]
MDTLQEQLTAVNAKIEAMHQKIEVISTQIAELLTSTRLGSESQPNGHISSISAPISSAPVTTHRDVLEEEDHMALNEARGKSMSQELQMQRLMAQLTAAYNRIAALEEQLLAQRIH